ncbi:MAG: TetR/AcrR family transcriptional regulator [Candidatus Lernaella stagnicola]|nr:TetR/AcrR family transcriptional regulator [Candidatus Lernaella stagnicola]
MSNGRKRDAERTRLALLTAAENHFTQRGFDAARVDDIAAEAGVNKRMIYVYFGSKQEMYQEVLRTNIELFLEDSRRLLSSLSDPYEQAVYALRHFFVFLAENPKFVRLLAWESLLYERWDHSRLADLLATGLQPMLDSVQHGVESGLFRKGLDAQQFIVSAVGICLTYFQKRLLLSAMWSQDLSDLDTREQVLDHIVALVFEGILARPAWPHA